jgi:hypothetical protein
VLFYSGKTCKNSLTLALKPQVLFCRENYCERMLRIAPYMYTQHAERVCYRPTRTTLSTWSVTDQHAPHSPHGVLQTNTHHTLHMECYRPTCTTLSTWSATDIHAPHSPHGVVQAPSISSKILRRT